jgi:pimeloyl-ACP methyl ester carboxylesterase
VIPQTRYARTADAVHIAYQVHGDGPIDLLMALGWTTNIEALWEEPSMARFLNRLASWSRLILFDKRGVGLSDRVPEAQLPSLETRMDDLRAVMDAAGSERGVVFGISEGGPMAMLFAATYPERTRGLLLFGTVADFTRGRDPENEPIELDRIERLWGTEEYARLALREWAAPSLADDERMVARLASYARRSASPGAAIALERMNSGMDASNILHAIHVPTLVIGRTGDLDFPIEDVRRTAEAIPGARFVELPGQDHFFFVGDTERLLVEIEHFLKEIRDDEAELDRVLATVLFTDIVGSTERAAALGDREWGVLRDSHHAKIRSNLGRFRGREVNTAGDGFLATFDGPIRAVRCAMSAVAAVRDLGIQIRVGLHTGEVELDGTDVRGIAVHIGARVASLAGPSEVLVSSTVKDLVAGAALEFEDRGEHELKGVPGTWRLYRLVA